jgi:hypothetical protein
MTVKALAPRKKAGRLNEFSPLSKGAFCHLWTIHDSQLRANWLFRSASGAFVLTSMCMRITANPAWNLAPIGASGVDIRGL